MVGVGIVRPLDNAIPYQLSNILEAATETQHIVGKGFSFCASVS